MPLWSSVMVGDWQIMTKKNINKRRYSTNPVEAHFKHLKVNMLQKKEVSCSEFMQVVYRNLQAVHKSFFSKKLNALTNEEPGMQK